VGLLIEAGGGAVAISDACAAERLNIHPLPNSVRKQLREFLEDRVPPSPARANPVDLVWVPFVDAPEIFATCLEIMARSVDSCLIICYYFIEDEAFLSQLEKIRDRYRKPIIIVPGNTIDQRRGMSLAVRRGIPTYDMPENAVKALAAMTRRAEYLRTLSTS
jgi:acyl-CoA synthetase (NDP forming)